MRTCVRRVIPYLPYSFQALRQGLAAAPAPVPEWSRQQQPRLYQETSRPGVHQPWAGPATAGWVVPLVGASVAAGVPPSKPGTPVVGTGPPSRLPPSTCSLRDGGALLDPVPGSVPPALPGGLSSEGVLAGTSTPVGLGVGSWVATGVAPSTGEFVLGFEDELDGFDPPSGLVGAAVGMGSGVESAKNWNPAGGGGVAFPGLGGAVGGPDIPGARGGENGGLEFMLNETTVGLLGPPGGTLGGTCGPGVGLEGTGGGDFGVEPC